MNASALLILLTLPGWLTGTWRSTTAGTTSEEVWSAADGTTMTGMHRDIAGGKTTWFEFQRVEQRGEQLVYVAQPGGKPPTEFKATKITDKKITFENPQHDFPKRIHYWREGKNLCAQIDDGTEQKAEKWCWAPVTK